MKCKLYNNTSSIRSILDVLCYYTRQKKITKKSQNLKNRHLKNKNLKNKNLKTTKTDVGNTHFQKRPNLQ